MNNFAKKPMPKWLKDGTSLKSLPPIYYGALAQVQIQPSILGDTKSKTGLETNNFLASRLKQKDFMDRYTDTERVHQILLASQLPNETMSHIWAFCNRSFPGKLTNRELCLALALVALLQNQTDIRFHKLYEHSSKETSNNIVDKNNSNPSTKSPTNKCPINLDNLFEIMRKESTPPVPKLYTSTELPASNKKRLIIEPLIDISDDINGEEKDITSCKDRIETNDNRNDNIELQEKNLFIKFKGEFILLEIDVECFKSDLKTQSIVWLSILKSMKRIFKKTFDVLQVQFSKQDAIEALISKPGKIFASNLSFCYPIAFNCKAVIDYLLKNFEKSIEDKQYFDETNDLMTSINEYWAVLINLLNDTGNEKSVGVVLDGLNYDYKSVLLSKTIGELADELFARERKNHCFICHNEKFLPALTIDSKMEFELESHLLDLLHADEKLLSIDEKHYYHVKCANFWLTQVSDSLHLSRDKLPFYDDTKLEARQSEILNPYKLAN